MTFNLFNRLILWFRKTFCISPKVKYLVKKLLAKVLSKKKPVEVTKTSKEKSAKAVLPEEKPIEEELIGKEKSKEEIHPEDETLKEERQPDQEKLNKEKLSKKPSEEEKSKEGKIEKELQTKHPDMEKTKKEVQKPYIKKKPTDEGKRPSENKNKQVTPKRMKEIDLGAKRKILKPIKQLPKVEKVSNKKNKKEFGREEAPARIESPIVEIDFDEAKVFLVIPKQQFKHSPASNIPQQLHYNLKLNGEEQYITLKVIEDNQGYIKVKGKRIELKKPLKSFQIVFPNELQEKVYRYSHSNENLYAFVAIGNNRGRMYYLYDKDGNINSLPNRMVWLLLHEDFKLETEYNYLSEETWIWEQYRPFRVNLKEMNELVIKNTKTSKEYKLPCEPTFSIEGQVIEDDFKDQMPLLIGETAKIKAPRENPCGWAVWIQNKIAGYKIITENWSGVKPLNLKLPDDLPCKYGEFQIDICQQDTRIPDETLFFRWLPFIELNYPKKLIIPNPYQGHKSEFTKVKVSNERWALNCEVGRKVEAIESNSYQIEVRPEENTIRFSINKKDKQEILTSCQITIPRLKWKTSKYEVWNGRLQNIKRDELIYGELFYILICTNDFNNRYNISAILETNGQRLQEEKFNQQGINYILELNQFYDTIKQNKNALRLKIEICRTRDYKLLGIPEILYFDAKQAIQKPSPSNIVSYDLINTLSLPKVCFVLRRIKTIYPKEKLACKEVLQFYYQEIKTKKRIKKNISVYKKAFVIRSLAIIKFIIGNYVDKIPIKGQKKWKRRIVLLQQTYPGELKNVLDSLMRGDKYAP